MRQPCRISARKAAPGLPSSLRGSGLSSLVHALQIVLMPQFLSGQAHRPCRCPVLFLPGARLGMASVRRFFFSFFVFGLRWWLCLPPISTIVYQFISHPCWIPCQRGPTRFVRHGTIFWLIPSLLSAWCYNSCGSTSELQSPLT